MPEKNITLHPYSFSVLSLGTHCSVLTFLAEREGLIRAFQPSPPDYRGRSRFRSPSKRLDAVFEPGRGFSPYLSPAFLPCSLSTRHSLLGTDFPGGEGGIDSGFSPSPPDCRGRTRFRSPSKRLDAVFEPGRGFSPYLSPAFFPCSLSTRHSLLGTDFPGGEGGIRTLEGCYTLPAFQASALDQLCDLSVIKGL